MEGIPSPYAPEPSGPLDGHEQLVEDVEDLLEMIDSEEFHDFKSKHPLPKMALIAELEKLITRAKEGWYDN